MARIPRGMKEHRNVTRTDSISVASYHYGEPTMRDYYTGAKLIDIDVFFGSESTAYAQLRHHYIPMLAKKDPQYYEQMNVAWEFSAFANVYDQLNRVTGQNLSYGEWRKKLGEPVFGKWMFRGTASEAKQYFGKRFEKALEKEG